MPATIAAPRSRRRRRRRGRQYPTGEREPVARVIEVLGRATDPGMEIEIALRKDALPFAFSKPALAQAKKLPDHVLPSERDSRVDLTGLPLVTIDGETAKDFDDAVFCERKGKGFRLVVAIADVSHYVRDGDAIDKDARERATSVYFPRRVIPMLPEALSNELCSLKPLVDRLCMVATWRSPRPATSAATSSTRRSCIRGAADLQRGVVVAVRPCGGDRSAREGPAPASPGPLCAVQGARPAPRRARGDRLRDRRAAARLRQERQDRAHRALAAQRRAQADRGMHARRERVRGGPARQGGSSCALPRARGPDAREARATAGVPRRERALAGRRRAAERASTTRSSSRRSSRAPTSRCCRPCLLRSLQRRATVRTTSATSAPRVRGLRRTSPIRRYPDLLVHRAINAVLQKKRYRPSGSNWEELGVHSRRWPSAAPLTFVPRDVEELAQVLVHAGQGRRGLRRRSAASRARHLHATRRPLTTASCT